MAKPSEHNPSPCRATPKKRFYATEKTARTASKLYRKRHNKEYAYYECPCGCWHLTTKH